MLQRTFIPKPMPVRDANAAVIDMDFSLVSASLRSISDRISTLSQAYSSVTPAMDSVTGTGTSGKIPIWTGPNTQGDSVISQSGSAISVAGTIAITSLTASLPVFTDASKRLVSNSMTGTGNVAMSDGPTFTTNIGTDKITVSAGNFAYFASTGTTQLLINSIGANYGTIQNDSANNWSLGYKTTGTNTLGTAVLSWNSSNLVTALSLQVTGTVGVGVAPSTNTLMDINGSNLSGNTSQYGLAVEPRFPSSATLKGTALYVQHRTAAASFTMATGYAIYVDVPVVGSGSAVTTPYGLFMENQPGYAIKTLSGGVWFGGHVGIGNAPDANGTTFLNLAGSSSGSGGGSFYGATINFSGHASDTTALHGLNVQFQGANSTTVASAYDIFLNGPLAGSGGSITTAYGLYVASITGGGTNYPIYTNSGLVRLGDTLQIVGNTRTGTSGLPNSSIALLVNNSALTGTSQVGVSSVPIFSTSATAQGVAFQAIPSTAASLHTAFVAGVAIADVVKGSGSVVDAQIGLYIQDLTGATNNTAIQTGVGSVLHGDLTGLFKELCLFARTTVNVNTNPKSFSVTGQSRLYVNAAGGNYTLTLTNPTDGQVIFIRNVSGFTITINFSNAVIPDSGNAFLIYDNAVATWYAVKGY